MLDLKKKIAKLRITSSFYKYIFVNSKLESPNLKFKLSNKCEFKIIISKLRDSYSDLILQKE